MQKASKKILRPGLHRKAVRVLAVIALIAYSLYLLEGQIRPVMMTMARYECQQLCVNAMNQAVADAIALQPDHLKDLYSVHTDATGKITSMVADALAVNTLKSELTVQVSQRLASLGANAVTIPFGTLLGWQMVAGRGPGLHLRIIQESYVESELSSKLVSSGLNQTELLVFITFTVTMGVILSGYTSDVEVQNEVCIAQALIVGDVPKVFMQ